MKSPKNILTSLFLGLFSVNAMALPLEDQLLLVGKESLFMETFSNSVVTAFLGFAVILSFIVLCYIMYRNHKLNKDFKILSKKINLTQKVE